MELTVFEQDKAYVQWSLENGEIDYMEVASEGAETDFFQFSTILKLANPKLALRAQTLGFAPVAPRQELLAKKS